jgi:hypothetical protein
LRCANARLLGDVPTPPLVVDEHEALGVRSVVSDECWPRIESSLMVTARPGPDVFGLAGLRLVQFCRARRARAARPRHGSACPLQSLYP